MIVMGGVVQVDLDYFSESTLVPPGVQKKVLSIGGVCKSLLRSNGDLDNPSKSPLGLLAFAITWHKMNNGLSLWVK
jgi:hypothetical protein